MTYEVIRQANLEEFGVKIRGAGSGKKNKESFPWEGLEIGDAFFVPDTDGVRSGTLSTYAFEKGRALKRRFSTHKATGGRFVVRVE